MNFKENVLFYLKENEQQARQVYRNVEDILFEYDYYPSERMRTAQSHDSYSIYIKAKRTYKSGDDIILVRVSDHKPSSYPTRDKPDYNVMYSPDSSLLTKTLKDFENQIKLRVKEHQ